MNRLAHRNALLDLPQCAVRHALAIGGPLIFALAFTKLLKLAQVRAHGAADDSLLYIGCQFLGLLAWYAVLPKLLALAALLIVLCRRAVRDRHAPWLAWPLAATLAYAATVEVAWLTEDPHPWFSAVLLTTLDELSRLASLWWRDALGASILIMALSAHFSTTLENPRRWQSIVVWSLIIAAYLLAGLDCGYFVATRSSLTGAELLYAIQSPADTLTITEWSISGASLFALLVPLLTLAVAAILLRETRHGPARLSYARAHRAPAGFLLATLALAIAAPAKPGDLAIEGLTRHTLWSLPFEALAPPIAAAIQKNAIVRKRSSAAPAEVAQPVAVASSGAPRLNVVIVMLESFRADATTLHASDLPTTPFLAELARESLVVDHMYAVVPRTSAAWIATLAGRYPTNGGATHRWARSGQHAPLESSLPRLLRTQGYISSFFTTATSHFEDNEAVLRALQFDETITREQIPAPAQGAATPFGWEDRAALPALNDWLERRTKDGKPFLLTFMTNVGHQPYAPPPGFAPYRFPHRNAAHLQYLNCVRYIDDFLREVVTALETHGLLENSVLVVLGDHGEEFLEHDGSVRGQVLYEESLHVPMLIRLPRAAGRSGTIRGLRQQIDVVPTVMELLGLELQDRSLPGRSLLSPEGHPTLFFSSHGARSRIAMRAGDRKYVYHFDSNSTRVFDLSRDPEERKDVQSTISPAVLGRIQGELQSWQAQVLDMYLQASAN